MHAPFYNEALARGAESPDTIEPFVQLKDLLSSGELWEEAARGNITVAMIRPQLAGATLANWTDHHAAESIESAIENLGIHAKFAVTFDGAAVEEFYGGGPKEVQLSLPPERHPEFTNRWEEFSDLMISGPSTVLLLFSPNNDAIPLWREQVGHYDIVNRRDPENLRGRFGLDNYNNLIHGSDSIQSVQRELIILSSLLDRQ